MKVLQINTTVNSGSTGRIVEEIGKILLASGHESVVGFGRGNRKSESVAIRVGSDWDMGMHGIQTLLFDRHGLASKNATLKFIEQVKVQSPDIIHLHNIHGYYLHYGVLGTFLAGYGKPVIWTLHDSWPFTGHCTYFDNISCERWKTGCFECPKKDKYPSSLLFDRSKQNFMDKKALFENMDNLHIITPSHWLSRLVEQSFLKKHLKSVIHNGVDLNTFSPKRDADDLLVRYNLSGKKILLGVASIWDPRKGLNDFIELSKTIDSKYHIVLIGLTERQISQLPENILGITRTEDTFELARWYSAASVFLNPTWQDNFPTTNIEALACGTPVVTYQTGGSPEAIDEQTGSVIGKGDLMAFLKAARFWSDGDVLESSSLCRKRAELFFDKNERFADYLRLYQSKIPVSD